MVYIIVFLIVVCFAFVVLVGPPYLPTLAPQVKVSLDLINLKPGQRLLELGCGDGKVLVAAAKRGWMVTGIELNPLLVLVCKARTWKYRRQVRVRWGNYWNTALWDDADALFGFVLPKYMAKLDRLIEAWRDGRAVVLASFAFAIPDKRIDMQRDGVFLYRYRTKQK